MPRPTVPLLALAALASTAGCNEQLPPGTPSDPIDDTGPFPGTPAPEDTGDTDAPASQMRSMPRPPSRLER